MKTYMVALVDDLGSEFAFREYDAPSPEGAAELFADENFSYDCDRRWLDPRAVVVLDPAGDAQWRFDVIGEAEMRWYVSQANEESGPK